MVCKSNQLDKIEFTNQTFLNKSRYNCRMFPSLTGFANVDLFEYLGFKELWDVEQDGGQGNRDRVDEDPGGVAHAQVKVSVVLRMADRNVPEMFKNYKVNKFI